MARDSCRPQPFTCFLLHHGLRYPIRWHGCALPAHAEKPHHPTHVLWEWCGFGVGRAAVSARITTGSGPFLSENRTPPFGWTALGCPPHNSGPPRDGAHFSRSHIPHLYIFADLHPLIHLLMRTHAKSAPRLYHDRTADAIGGFHIIRRPAGRRSPLAIDPGPSIWYDYVISSFGWAAQAVFKNALLGWEVRFGLPIFFYLGGIRNIRRMIWKKPCLTSRSC